MANGISFACLSGNLTRDAELNDSGRVLSFGIAVNRREKNLDGEYGDVAHFFDVKVLGNRAEGLSSLLTKGSKVTVIGDLVQERWEKDGERRSAVRVIAREVVLGGSRQDAEPASGESNTGPGW